MYFVQRSQIHNSRTKHDCAATSHTATNMADSPPDAIMEGSAPPPPPKKRSLFTKKVVSKKAEAGDSVAFFSRAGELQAQKLAEEERRRKRKLVRLEREKERKRSTESRERKGTTPEQKRRRLSGKEDEDGYRDMDQQSSGGLRKSDGDHEDEDIIIRSRRSGEAILCYIWWMSS